MPPPLIQIQTTTPDKETADKLATMLVEARLAACVQVTQAIESTFRWEGKVLTEQEFRLMIKARNEDFEEIAQLIEANHPYEVPQIIATPLLNTNLAYFKWLMAETKRN